MHVFLDTNVILRALVDDPVNPHLSEQARSFFRTLEEGKITAVTHILMIAECVYVLESIYRVKRKEIQIMLTALLHIESLTIADKPLVFMVLDYYVKKNVDFEDAYAVIEMRKIGISTIYTFDRKHFGKFAELTILPK